MSLWSRLFRKKVPAPIGVPYMTYNETRLFVREDKGFRDFLEWFLNRDDPA